MATAVPYSGTLSVAPEDRPISPEHIDTPIQAFGGATAAATEGLGSTLGKVGDELFARANAMQELNQQAAANAAAADFTTQLGALHTKVVSLEGKAAVDAAAQFPDQVNELRSKVRDSLGSPYAQTMYDRDSRLMQSRAVWSIGEFAANQNKAYLTQSINAQNVNTNNAVMANPTDEVLAAHGMRETQHNANQLANLKGLPEGDPARKEIVDDAVSKRQSARLYSLANQQPGAAKALMDKIQQGPTPMGGVDAAKTDEYIQKKQNEVGSRQDSASIFAGTDGGMGTAVVDTGRAQAGVKAVTGGNYSYVGVPGKDGSHPVGAYNVPSGQLASWLGAAGMPPMTEQAFLQDAKAQDQLFNSRFGGLQRGKSFNDATKQWMVDTGMPTADGDVATNLVKANAGLARASSETQIDAAARAKAALSRPGDDVYGDRVATQALTLHRQAHGEQQQDELTNQHTVGAAIMTPTKDGKFVTSIEEARRNDPTGQFGTAWDAMSQYDQGKALLRIAHNAGDGYAKTEENQAQYTRLVGMVRNPTASQKDLGDFLSMDMSSLHMPNAQALELQKLQMQVYHRSQGNPQLTGALQQLSASDPAIRDILAGDKSGDDRAMFVGGLYNGIDQFMSANKKPPGREDIKEIGNQLMRQMTVPRSVWHPLTTSDNAYHMAVPAEERQGIVDRMKQDNPGVEPTEVQVHNAFVANRFNQFYSTKGKPSGQ